MSDLDDNDIIKGILAPGNSKIRQFQEELYSRYISRVYEKCYFLTKDRNAANDLAHDVFILVFTKLNTFKGISPFFGWIDAITYHHCLGYLKKKKMLVSDENETFDISNLPDEVEELTYSEELIGKLESAFNTIPEDMRLVLLMKYRYKLGVKQIAEHLEISDSAVKMRLKRSRDYLATILNSEN